MAYEAIIVHMVHYMKNQKFTIICVHKEILILAIIYFFMFFFFSKELTLQNCKPPMCFLSYYHTERAYEHWTI